MTTLYNKQTKNRILRLIQFLNAVSPPQCKDIINSKEWQRDYPLAVRVDGYLFVNKSINQSHATRWVLFLLRVLTTWPKVGTSRTHCAVITIWYNKRSNHDCYIWVTTAAPFKNRVFNFLHTNRNKCIVTSKATRQCLLYYVYKA